MNRQEIQRYKQAFDQAIHQLDNSGIEYCLARENRSDQFRGSTKMVTMESEVKRHLDRVEKRQIRQTALAKNGVKGDD